jgi:hypothetical protein
VGKKKPKRIFFHTLDDDMKDVIEEIADELGVPPADIMNLITLDGIEDIEQGKKNLDALISASRHPRYSRRLDLSERLARFRKRRKR